MKLELTDLPRLATQRLLLLLRPAPAHLAISQALHGDPATHAFNPIGPATPGAAAHQFDTWQAHWHQHGFGYWALSRLDDPERVLGFGGIMHKTVGNRPGLNLYYRLTSDAWGQGYASEMAWMALRVAFELLDEPEVLGLVRPENVPSRRLLERLGLGIVDTCDDRPGLAPSLIYRLTAEDYRRQSAAALQG
ncbi:MAG: GNAT family N-acetyltransferase [Pseudomonas sp.]|uniref:GNAT family N-acetyltransferase n=1 Tax=Pseudomonas sp. TaxID=306 RepID=UPI003395EE11